MADYPEEIINKLDSGVTAEAWSLIGLYLLDIVVVVVALYIIGEVANSVL
jgi:hypothetical protein